MRTGLTLGLLLFLPGMAFAQATPARVPHIVLVGDSTVTEGSGWGLGFRQLVTGAARVTNTAAERPQLEELPRRRPLGQGARAEGRLLPDPVRAQRSARQGAGARDRSGDDLPRQPGPLRRRGARDRRNADPRHVAGAPHVQRGRSGDADVDARAVGRGGEAGRRGEARAADRSRRVEPRAVRAPRTGRRLRGFNLKKDDGTWDTTHLDAAGSAAFARLVVDELRRVVPALAPLLRDDVDRRPRGAAGFAAAAPVAGGDAQQQAP